MEKVYILLYITDPGYIEMLFARRRAAAVSDGSTWIAIIKRGNTRVCAGVQLSNQWILTLNECIDRM